MNQANQRAYAFIGSYAEAAEPGIYVCSYDVQTGQLALLQSISGLKNPTFLEVDAANNRLYALTEQRDAEGKASGAAVSFRIDPDQATVTVMNQMITTPATTCHLSLDHSKSCLFVASYHGGMIAMSAVEADGTVGPLKQMHQHEGASVHPVQTQARPHSVFIAPSNRFAVVPDLGLDVVFVYQLDAANRQLLAHGKVSVQPGAGPRHFAFHPKLPYGYVINELNSTVTAFQYDDQAGCLTEIHTVSTLPADYKEDNGCADLHLSPDGRFLYGSNRGHDSIVVYEVSSTDGSLTLVQHQSTLGGHPRNFALSPDGRFLLAANRDGNHIVTFSRDAHTGKLTPTGSELKLSKPVCVKLAIL